MAKHADRLDDATETAQMFVDHGLSEVQRKNKPEQVQRDDGTWPTTECLDCGVDIPQGRLALGRVLCVDCQAEKEKTQRGYK